jgi:fucose permease
MTNKIPFRLFALIIFIAGTSFSLTGAVLPDMAERFGLTNAEASKLPLAYFTGDLCGLVFLGFALARPRLLLKTCLLILPAAALAVALYPGYSDLLLVPFFLLGGVAGIVITLPSMIVSRMIRGDSARMMNLMFGFFSAGVMVAPVGFGGLRLLGVHYPAAFFVLAGLGTLAAVMVFVTPIPAPDLGQGLMPRAVAGLWRENKGLLLGVSAMNLFYVGAEAVPNAWIPKYLHDTFPGGSELRSVAVLSLFWAGVTAGRFICAELIKRGVPPRGMLAALSGAAAVCLLAAPAVENRLAAEALFAASGLFFSGMFPIILAYTDRLPESSGGTLFVVVMAAGMLGASVVSRSVGLVAEALSFQWGMSIASGLSLLVLALIPVLGGRKAG